MQAPQDSGMSPPLTKKQKKGGMTQYQRLQLAQADFLAHHDPVASASKQTQAGAVVPPAPTVAHTGTPLQATTAVPPPRSPVAPSPPIDRAQAAANMMAIIADLRAQAQAKGAKLDDQPVPSHPAIEQNGGSKRLDVQEHKTVSAQPTTPILQARMVDVPRTSTSNDLTSESAQGSSINTIAIEPLTRAAPRAESVITAADAPPVAVHVLSTTETTASSAPQARSQRREDRPRRERPPLDSDMGSAPLLTSSTIAKLGGKTPEDIAAWIAERKSRWPSRDNVAKREKLALAKAAQEQALRLVKAQKKQASSGRSANGAPSENDGSASARLDVPDTADDEGEGPEVASSKVADAAGEHIVTEQSGGPSSNSDPRYKTRKCKYFFTRNGCKNGDKCTFSHGEPGTGPTASRDRKRPISGGSTDGPADGTSDAAGDAVEKKRPKIAPRTMPMRDKWRQRKSLHQRLVEREEAEEREEAAAEEERRRRGELDAMQLDEDHEHTGAQSPARTIGDAGEPANGSDEDASLSDSTSCGSDSDSDSDSDHFLEAEAPAVAAPQDGVVADARMTLEPAMDRSDSSLTRLVLSVAAQPQINGTAEESLVDESSAPADTRNQHDLPPHDEPEPPTSIDDDQAFGANIE